MQQPCSFLLDRERGKSREGPFGLRPYTGRTADEQYKEESAGCKNEILFFFSSASLLLVCTCKASYLQQCHIFGCCCCCCITPYIWKIMQHYCRLSQCIVEEHRPQPFPHSFSCHAQRTLHVYIYIHAPCTHRFCVKLHSSSKTTGNHNFWPQPTPKMHTLNAYVTQMCMLMFIQRGTWYGTTRMRNRCGKSSCAYACLLACS